MPPHKLARAGFMCRKLPPKLVREWARCDVVKRRPAPLPVPAGFPAGPLPAHSEVVVDEADWAGGAVGVALHCFALAGERRATYTTTFRCTGAARKHLQLGGYFHMFAIASPSASKDEEEGSDGARGEEVEGGGAKGVVVDVDEPGDEDDAQDSLGLWCHSMRGGSAASCHTFKVTLTAPGRVVAFIRTCEYLEMELDKDPKGSQSTKQAQKKRLSAEKSSPKERKQVHWAEPLAQAATDEQDPLDARWRSFVSAAINLEATAEAAEACYKEVVTRATEVSEKSDHLQDLLTQANTKIRNLEMEIQAKDQQLERARQALSAFASAVSASSHV